MHITAAFSRVLNLPGGWVRSVCFEPRRVVVTVALHHHRLHCPKCEFWTRHGESSSIMTRSGTISIRVLRLEVHARLRRLRCPERGALVDGVPFARGDARFTRDFEDLVAWLATRPTRPRPAR